MLDLTKVDSSEPVVPPGEYCVCVEDAVLKQTKSGTGEYILCRFKILYGEYRGCILLHRFVIKNDSPKITEIGLKSLKRFMEIAGAKSFILYSPADLIGLRAVAVANIRSNEYGKTTTISYFKRFDRTKENNIRLLKELYSNEA